MKRKIRVYGYDNQSGMTKGKKKKEKKIFTMCKKHVIYEIKMCVYKNAIEKQGGDHPTSRRSLLGRQVQVERFGEVHGLDWQRVKEGGLPGRARA